MLSAPTKKRTKWCLSGLLEARTCKRSWRIHACLWFREEMYESTLELLWPPLCHWSWALSVQNYPERLQGRINDGQYLEWAAIQGGTQSVVEWSKFTASGICCQEVCSIGIRSVICAFKSRLIHRPASVSIITMRLRYVEPHRGWSSGNCMKFASIVDIVIPHECIVQKPGLLQWWWWCIGYILQALTRGSVQKVRVMNQGIYREEHRVRGIRSRGINHFTIELTPRAACQRQFPKFGCARCENVPAR